MFADESEELPHERADVRASDIADCWTATRAVLERVCIAARTNSCVEYRSHQFGCTLWSR